MQNNQFSRVASPHGSVLEPLTSCFVLAPNLLRSLHPTILELKLVVLIVSLLSASLCIYNNLRATKMNGVLML